jgi:transcriptional regulator with XRE-family HTH domain
MNLSEEISLRLQLERRRIGLSQAELAELAGVSRACQSNYELNKSVPDLIYSVKAAAAGVDMSYVTTGNRESARAAETLDWPLAGDIISAIDTVAADLEIEITPSMVGPLLKVLYEFSVKRIKAQSATDTTREVLEALHLRRA